MTSFRSQQHHTVGVSEFLESYAGLLQADSGHITLAQQQSPFLKDTDQPGMLSFRASDGKSTNLVTQVAQEELVSFFNKINEVNRAGMTVGMKKRDRKKKAAKKLIL